MGKGVRGGSRRTSHAMEALRLAETTQKTIGWGPRESLAFCSRLSVSSAFSGFLSLVDAAEVDLRNQRFRDLVERVDLRLHCGVRYLRRLGGDEMIVV